MNYSKQQKLPTYVLYYQIENNDEIEKSKFKMAQKIFRLSSNF